uniref:Putative secreted salivary protein n=1 Tax=Ixodes ricinus TaxID=34613 RepID=A0A090X7X4_IXORI
MKATIAVTSFLTLQFVLIFCHSVSKIVEHPDLQQCASLQVILCTFSITLRNITGRCEHETGCETGPNNFPTKEKCETECPYGKKDS